jgi:hypothetical protein
MYQAPPDQRPKVPRGTRCHGCECLLQPDALTVGVDFIQWKRSTPHTDNCTVGLKLAKSRGAVTINKAQLKKMVPAADLPAYLDTVAAYKIDFKAKMKETKKTKKTKKK